MSRYPKPARGASLKCLQCNAPVVETVGHQFVCVARGDQLIRTRK